MRIAKLRQWSLATLWLAVVCTAIVLAIVRRERWGVWETGALLISGALLAIFVTDVVLGGGSGGSMRARMGDYATLAALVGAVIVLASFLLYGLFTPSLTQSIVVGAFLVVFVRILRDYLRALRKRHRGSA